MRPEPGVFGCHHHVGTTNSFVGDADSSFLTSVDLAEDMTARVAGMDRDGISQAALMPSPAYERPNGYADTRAVNDAVARYRDQAPQRFPVALGVVEPLHGAVSLGELERCHRDLGLVGISFHTRFQGVSVNHPWVLRYVERMGELGLLPVLHAIPESEAEALWKIMELARKFRDLEMLVLDAFATFDGVREAFVVADVCSNLSFDTSLARNAPLIEDFIRQFGAARVVFGTDTYSGRPRRRLPHILSEIKSFDITDDEKRLIMGGNARRLYRSPEP